jgi:hypothetical protein
MLEGVPGGRGAFVIDRPAMGVGSGSKRVVVGLVIGAVGGFASIVLGAASAAGRSWCSSSAGCPSAAGDAGMTLGVAFAAVFGLAAAVIAVRVLLGERRTSSSGVLRLGLAVALLLPMYPLAILAAYLAGATAVGVLVMLAVLVVYMLGWLWVCRRVLPEPEGYLNL